jgi:protein TonB
LPVDLSGDNKSFDPPPPPPDTKKVEPVQPAKTQTIVRQVSTVLQGSATRRVQPVYPILARNARISGQVVVEVTIDEEGNVIGARALSGHALLKQVSLDAAFGWKWRPTLLNGVPVKVIGTITFNFQL